MFCDSSTAKEDPIVLLLKHSIHILIWQTQSCCCRHQPCCALQIGQLCLNNLQCNILLFIQDCSIRWFRSEQKIIFPILVFLVFHFLYLLKAAKVGSKIDFKNTVFVPQDDIRCWVLQVYFILELNELTKASNKKGGEKFRREHKATLELANAVGRKTKGNGPNALTKGCVMRLQQLSDKGYLAVKRPKGDQPKPPLYPGD